MHTSLHIYQINENTFTRNNCKYNYVHFFYILDPLSWLQAFMVEDQHFHCLPLGVGKVFPQSVPPHCTKMWKVNVNPRCLRCSSWEMPKKLDKFCLNPYMSHICVGASHANKWKWLRYCSVPLSHSKSR